MKKEYPNYHCPVGISNQRERKTAQSSPSPSKKELDGSRSKNSVRENCRGGEQKPGQKDARRVKRVPIFSSRQMKPRAHAVPSLRRCWCRKNEASDERASGGLKPDKPTCNFSAFRNCFCVARAMDATSEKNSADEKCGKRRNKEANKRRKERERGMKWRGRGTKMASVSRSPRKRTIFQIKLRTTLARICTSANSIAARVFVRVKQR